MEFTINQIATKNELALPDLKYIVRMGALSETIGAATGQKGEKREREWTRLDANEAIFLSFTGTFYRDIRIIKPSILATKQALKGFPVLLKPFYDIRRLPWLIIFENYTKTEASQIAWEFVDVQNLKNHEPPLDIPVSLRLQIGKRTVLSYNQEITKNRGLFIYAVSDLLFGFLKNLNLKFSDIDPRRLFGLNSTLDFNQFIENDLEKVLTYLKKEKK